VLACLANSQDNRVEAAEKAEGLLYDMRSRWKAGDKTMQPTIHTFNTVMNAWARAGKPLRADSVFNLMCDDFKKGNELAKPSTTSFNSKYCLRSLQIDQAAVLMCNLFFSFILFL
jgi:pentatricopeptide repeat protein